MACADPGSGVTNGGRQPADDPPVGNARRRRGWRRLGLDVDRVAAAVECGRLGVFDALGDHARLHIVAERRIQRDGGRVLGARLRDRDPGGADVGGREADDREGGEHAQNAAAT